MCPIDEKSGLVHCMCEWTKCIFGVGFFVLYKAFTIVLIATCGNRSISWCKIESIIAFSANFVSVMSPLFGAATKDDYPRYRWKAGAISHITRNICFSLNELNYSNFHTIALMSILLCLMVCVYCLSKNYSRELPKRYLRHSFSFPFITQPFERWGDCSWPLLLLLEPGLFNNTH